MALQVSIHFQPFQPLGRDEIVEIIDNVVVPPLEAVKSFFAVAQKVAEGAGGDGAKGALGVHNLLPPGQVVGAGQAVGGCSGRICDYAVDWLGWFVAP